ncbi:MAG: SMI1/KNR4 family protein [Marinifilaceae bacterium]|jgi:hypothetical protein|nr:SMI1/KNR4 family protein [Marinifilaceae bacterium]
MNYIDLLKTHSGHKDIALEIKKFELDNNIELPSIYRCFILNYDLTNLCSYDLLSYYDEVHNSTLQLYSVEFTENPNITIDSLYKIEDIKEKMYSIYNTKELNKFKDYIAIGESFNQGILMLGVGNYNYDQIFIEYAHEEERIIKISDNIFDFMTGFSVIVEEDYLPDSICVENLYKNWGEDFWRVKK